MKRLIKRIALIVSCILILTTVNCFAYTIETDTIITENGEKYNVKTYNVTTDEERAFIQNLEDNYIAEGVNYTLTNIKKR